MFVVSFANYKSRAQPGLKVKFLNHTVDQGKMTPTVSSTEGQIFNFEFVWNEFRLAGVNNGVSKCRPEGRQEGVIVLGVILPLGRVAKPFFKRPCTGHPKKAAFDGAQRTRLWISRRNDFLPALTVLEE